MQNITDILTGEFKKPRAHIQNVIELIDGGNTIPFIARYRKEMTGAMDDQVLRELSERLLYLRSLEARREEIKASIQAQGKLTPELAAALDGAATLSEAEDLYRPYKPKRRTRASIARERGLEPLADLLFAQTDPREPLLLAADFVDAEKEVADAGAALAGARDIMAERISDDAGIRRRLRAFICEKGVLKSVAAKEEDSVYRLYYDYSEPIGRVQGHRLLAVDRGEREGFLKVSIEYPTEGALEGVYRSVLNYGAKSPSTGEVALAAADGFERLIRPSMERELRNMLTSNACEGAIHTFALNLKPLLMQPPVKNRVTLGFDPAYRTGCKLAVVDGTGKVLTTEVIYPTPPHNKKAEAEATLKELIRRYRIEVIAIGNGTASRESEVFVAEAIKGTGVSYMVVSEAGASVYSASKLAAGEFPDYDVSLRSAVSIARRLQDPLAELVKIDPKSIGVGQYQHDMPQAELGRALDGVVEDCVNAVGVDINTASAPLLGRVAGINGAVAGSIVAYREENGAFQSRKALKKVPKLGAKTFEQCAGFLRVPEADNVLDNTGVHPESYEAALKLLELTGYALKDVKAGGLTELKARVAALGTKTAALRCGIGELTLKDIVAELTKPGRDPRDELPPPLLRRDVMDMNDLKPGMELTGTVRNVVDFGAFVDIGVHQDGLVHISQLCDRFIKHPSEAVKTGDIVTVRVLEVQPEKKRISLTMKTGGSQG